MSQIFGLSKGGVSGPTGAPAPGTTTTNAIALWKDTTGTKLKNSLWTIDSDGNLDGSNGGGNVSGVNIYYGANLDVPYILSSNNGAVTIDTSNYLFYDAASVPSIGWNSDRVLYDSVGNLSIDWNTRRIRNSGGTNVIAYEDLTMFDSSGITSINWNARQLQNSAGTVVAVWGGDSLTLNAMDGSVAIDWRLRALVDPATRTELSWDSTGVLLPQLSSNSVLATDSNRYIAITGVTPTQLALAVKAEISLFDDFADANNSTTSETNLITQTLAANQLVTNGDKVFMEAGGIFTGAATATQELKVYFGGTVIFDSGALSIGAVTSNWEVFVMVMRESSTVVRCITTYSSSSAALSVTTTYTRVTGLTLSGTNVFKITGQAAGVGAASSQITSKLGNISYLKH